jgi:hypothetical protein
MKASMSGVPFRTLPNDNEHGIPEDLTDFASAIMNNQHYAQNEQYIYQKYVHQSEIDAEDRAALYKIKSYVGDLAHAPEESGIRTIFPNNSSEAVIPEENDNPSARGAEINTDKLNVD